MSRVSFIIVIFTLLTIFDPLKSEENYNNLIKHHITWFSHNQSGSKVSSGIYFHEMRGEDFIQIRKMLLIK